MADDIGTIHSVTEGGIAADHVELPLPPAIVAATHSGNEQNTLKQSIAPIACWRTHDGRFKFESSFVLPEIATEMDALKHLIDRHTLKDEQRAEHKPVLSVFGHADPTGSDDLNKALSGRRAAAIYGMLTRREDIWEDLFSNGGKFTHALPDDKWDTEVLGTMLDTVTLAAQPSATGGPQPQSTNPDAGATASDEGSPVDQEREKKLNKLQHDSGERKKLFKAYMDTVCVTEIFRLEAADQTRLQNQGAEIAGKLTTMLDQEFGKEKDFIQAVRKVAGAGELARDKIALLKEAKKKKPFVVEPVDFLGGGKDKEGKADYQGCGEFNPVFLQSQADIDRFKKVPESSPEKPILKAVRDAANEPDRRVLIFLFRPEIRIGPDVWPCPRAKEGVDGCRKRFFSDGDNRRNMRLALTPRKFEDRQDTFACRFYDRLSNNSPCERGVITFRIRLYDPSGVAISGAPFEITLDNREPIQGKAGTTIEEEGIVEVTTLELTKRCAIKWGFPREFEKDNDDDDFDLIFSLDMFLIRDNLSEDDEAKQKLHNLGYPIENDSIANVKAFRRDYGHLAKPPLKEGSGRLSDDQGQTINLLREVYEQCAQDILNTPPGNSAGG